LKAKWTKTDEMLQKMLNCVTTGEHNMCQNISQKHEDANEKDAKHEDDAKPKMEMIQELKPYVECMKTCMNASEDSEHHQKFDKDPKELHESKQHGWKHFTRQMWGGLFKCKKALNCKLEHDAKKESISGCMKSTGVNKDAYCTVKRDFCNCFRQILGKTEEEMPCSRDDEHTEEPHVAHTTAAHAAHGH